MAVETLRPNAGGDTTDLPIQFPNSDFHYDKVDEAVEDEDTTYVESDSTAGFPYKYDLYNLEALTSSGITITNVKVGAYVRRSGSYDVFAALYIKTGGTAYASGLKSMLSTYNLITNSWATNPQTGVAWVEDDIPALQAGIGLGWNTSNGARCTQLYVEVTYTAAFIPKVFII